MKQNSGSRRSNELAREKLANILLYEIADPDLAFVTITGVEVSVDRSFMRVYVSCEPDRYDEVLAALARAQGRIRSLLGRSLGWRVTPEIAFTIDTTTDEAERIARALENVPETMSIEKDEQGYPVEHEDGSEEGVSEEGGEAR